MPMNQILRLMVGISVGWLAASAHGTTTFYVRTNSPTDGPGTAWSNAFRTIQGAVNVATNGDTVLVSNGVYATGCTPTPGWSASNRIVVAKAITVRSVNGPEWTIIKGQGPLTNYAVRCAFLTNNAILDGFTLSNGFTRAVGDRFGDRAGGGAAAIGATVSNCIVTGCSAMRWGGGIYGGIVSTCMVTRNSTIVDSSGGGVMCATVYNSTIVSNTAGQGGGNQAGGGGGAYLCTIENSLIASNSAGYGGGAAFGTLRNCNIVSNKADTGGGLCSATASNCVIAWNYASSGGGAYFGEIANSTIYGNTALSGGGGAWCTLRNCTVSANSAYGGGGTVYATLYNCIVYHNLAVSSPNLSGGSAQYTCTTPNPGGTGNFTNDPALVSAFHIASDSPCVATGNFAYAVGTDIDGEAWLNPPSIGCDQYITGGKTGALFVAIRAAFTSVTATLSLDFTADIVGKAAASTWSFGDGAGATNLPVVSHAWAVTGAYPVVLTAFNDTYPAGVAATVTVRVIEQPTYYVYASNSTPAYPFTAWTNAATNIQDAIDACSVIGARVLVSNGLYNSGGTYWPPSWGQTNRVRVSKHILLESVNGPQATTIAGGGALDDTAVRCVFLDAGTTLSGFTLTNGFFAAWPDGTPGAGAHAAGAMLTNCVIAGCASASYGGGVQGGTLFRCTLRNNYAGWRGAGLSSGTGICCTIVSNRADMDGGGAYQSYLDRCLIADNDAGSCGGVSGGTVNNSVIRGNFSKSEGGGVGGATVNNCSISGNSALGHGGGSASCTLNNCTIVWNTATVSSGGDIWSTLNNCIAYHNSAPAWPNGQFGSAQYTCTVPDYWGNGCITNDPLLVNASHIASNSPCVAAGSYAYVSGVDLDGEAWLDPPSMGCDQYVAGAVTGSLKVAILAPLTNTLVALPLDFIADVSGRVAQTTWSFGDGTGATNWDRVTHAWGATGRYPVVLSAYNDTYPAGVAATVSVWIVEQALYYVRSNNPKAAYPFNAWTNAATNIQTALDACNVQGGKVLVSNGVYAVGESATPHATLKNRIVVAKRMTVQSVNGPQFTAISGGKTIADLPIRCAYLDEQTVLSGFTLSNGYTSASGSGFDQYGGGVYAASSAIVTNCVIVRNSAQSGGGVYGGVVQSCTLRGNSAVANGGGAVSATICDSTLSGNEALNGGGAYNSVASNCMVAGNWAISGGGLYSVMADNCAIYGNQADNGGGAIYGSLRQCTVSGNSAQQAGGGMNGSSAYNTISYFNTAATGSNAYGGYITYSCLTPDPAPGNYNMEADPLLASSSHLSSNSPCRGQGSSIYSFGFDIDGEAWANPPAMGCDEYVAGAVTGQLTVAIQAQATNVVVNRAVNFAADIRGKTHRSAWAIGGAAGATNQPYISRAWSSTGNYPVVLSAYNTTYPAGVSATVTVRVVQQAIYYVNVSNATPAYPYNAWTNAATNIQAAVNACIVLGGTVLVTNGIYSSGSAITPHGAHSNRVVVTNAILLKSVNGPLATTIEGGGMLSYGDEMRCAFLSGGAAMSGFTLSKGNTAYYSDDSIFNFSGGGVFASGAFLTNCIIRECNARNDGGGVYGGVLDNCKIENNYAYQGGGIAQGSAQNCLIISNTADTLAGGALQSALANCTISGNQAYNSLGGGAHGGSLINCIVWGNTASWDHDISSGTPCEYSCSPDAPAGLGNITNSPAFIGGGNYHLSSTSPCIDAGTNMEAIATDLDGKPRPAEGDGDGIPEWDMGAYEYHGVVLACNVTNFALNLPPDMSATQTFAVWNGVTGTLAYAVSNSALWLTLWPTSGTSTGEHDAIEARYNATGLIAGVYTDTVVVTGTDAGGSPRLIPVLLNVYTPDIHYVVAGNPTAEAP
jgi:hypothetical protein